MFIEADILMSQKLNVPIMAHPPDVESDLTYDEWLNKCKNSNKGLKLDFKSENVIEQCLIKLKMIKNELKMPIILNADVLQANYESPKVKINPQVFLNLSKTYYQNGILSIGWTSINSSKLNYSWLNVYEMYNLVKKHSLDSDNQVQLTFPVRLNWSIKSLYRLHWLHMFTGGSLTIWSHETDELTSYESMLLFRKLFSNSVIYYDLPKNYSDYLTQHIYAPSDELNKHLQESNDPLVSYYLRSFNFKADLWSSIGNVLISDYGALIHDYNSSIVTVKEYKSNEKMGILYELNAKFQLIPVKSASSTSIMTLLNNENLNKNSNNENNNYIDITNSLVDTTSSNRNNNNASVSVNLNEKSNNSILNNTTSTTPNDNECVKISFRSSQNENDNDNSIGIYLYISGLVRLEVNGVIKQEGNLNPASNLFEFTITDVGESKDIHIDINSYDLSMNKYSLQFLLKSSYAQNQKFFIKITSLSKYYAIGIDQLRLTDEILDPQDNQANY